MNASTRSACSGSSTQDLESLPARLQELGIYYRKSGRPVPRRLLDPVAREAMKILGSDAFQFSRETEIYNVILDESGSYLKESSDMALPPDLIFVNRTLSGLFGNLCSLGSNGKWAAVLEPYTR